MHMFTNWQKISEKICFNYFKKQKNPPHINFKSEQGAAACPHQSNEDEYFKINDAFFCIIYLKKNQKQT